MAADRPTDELLRRILAAVAADDAAPEIRQLITECRTEAEAEVKAVIKTAIKAALLRRAVEELELTSNRAPAPAKRASAARAPADKPTRYDDDDDQAFAQPGRLDAFAAAMSSPEAGDQSASQLSDQTATVCYVYAITASRSDTWTAGVTSIDPAFPLRIVRQGDVQAVVSDVAVDEFQQENLDRRATQPEWVESKVRAHDEVIRSAMETGAVIPCRFCTVLRDDNDVQRLLSVHHQQIAQTLAELDGKQEWGVKVFAVPLPAEKAAGGDSAEGGGKAYMQRRKREETRRDELDREARAHARACHDKLASLAAEAVILPRRSRASGGQSGEPLLNGAYLVRQKDINRFHALVAALNDKHGPLGLDFQMTGPWPPYNFVHLDLSLEAAA